MWPMPASRTMVRSVFFGKGKANRPWLSVDYLADKVVFITGVENDARKWHGELLLLCMVRRRQIENGHAEA